MGKHRNPANWSGNSVPDSSAAHADLIESTASPAHVLLNGDRTISHLTLDNGPYIIDAGTPGSTLKLGQFTNNGYIDVLGAQHAINATVLLSGFGGTPVEMTVASGATLTLANLSNIHYTPIHKLGAGRLIINGMQHPTFTYPLIPFAVDGGQVDLNANAGTPATASDSAIAYTDLTVSGESKVVLGALIRIWIIWKSPPPRTACNRLISILRPAHFARCAFIQGLAAMSRTFAPISAR